MRVGVRVRVKVRVKVRVGVRVRVDVAHGHGPLALARQAERCARVHGPVLVEHLVVVLGGWGIGSEKRKGRTRAERSLAGYGFI